MSGNRSKAEATAELLKLGLAPRLLDLELAAAYVSLSAAAFLRGVADGRYPKPLTDGKRQRWTAKCLTPQLTDALASAHRPRKRLTI